MGGSAIITLVTDFGWGDGYIGAMKGVILRINPQCHIIDLAHEITPHDVASAALILGQTYPYFPQGTIHVAVVDPGVGGTRRPLILECEGSLFVGPDNGIFTLVLQREEGIQAYELAEQRFFLPHMSYTFRGRDIFAPAAAHLSLGASPGTMGPSLPREGLTTLDIPSPMQKADTIYGEVVSIDRFGNLITNIPQDLMRAFAPNERLQIEIDGETIEGLRSSYVEGKAGEIIALWGSNNMLELSLKERSLHADRKWNRGEQVRIWKKR